MKVYFIYRTVYKPFGRYIKEFEADSVLDFFTRNWEILSEDEESLLGISVYGFPIADEDESVSSPQTIAELESTISEHVYSNEVKADEHCIQVLTDDDEVELMWAIFDEVYVHENPEITAVWLTPEYPSTISETPYKEDVEGLQLTQSGKELCNTYYMSAIIYDSGNFDDLAQPVIFNGTSLPNLPEYIKNIEIEKDENNSYKVDETRLFQKVCKANPQSDMGTLLQEFTGIDFAELPEYEGMSDDFEGEAVNKAIIKFHGKHCVEVAAVSIDAYNYFVWFDDYWLAANPVLGKSILHFFSTPSLTEE